MGLTVGVTGQQGMLTYAPGYPTSGIKTITENYIDEYRTQRLVVYIHNGLLLTETYRRIYF
jgi:hypothetical protein